MTTISYCRRQNNTCCPAIAINSDGTNRLTDDFGGAVNYTQEETEGLIGLYLRHIKRHNPDAYQRIVGKVIGDGN